MYFLTPGEYIPHYKVLLNLNPDRKSFFRVGGSRGDKAVKVVTEDFNLQKI